MLPMDLIARNKRLFNQVDKKLACLLEIIGQIVREPSSLPSCQAKAKNEMKEVLERAQEIGGKLFKDVQALNRDFLQFLKKPDHGTMSSKMIEDALRIKHEMREL